ncbi:alkyl hydroperoxide reductase/ Thiol specific antioxidant/ Mal allergen [Chloroherpeton thalassium ATCC 35110]|uniref:Alkyl hydroperoxide reductase/ Thiol specific antioxidant/ Mal allergen n=1 Tax=Chloroherpeton thalassium (strain ATCC 35110 / GB-78) TaxID=517418 RepID=B3QSD6_CHLT3|nr:thioredoxin family protein [Chloroherpeton thalassium]ACF12527.1 alkyl hydroperoxide reductase/ Thiol specific antioxidant/ Mal allergen [Chloroherpeton thalassium ATCC 35110]
MNRQVLQKWIFPVILLVIFSFVSLAAAAQISLQPGDKAPDFSIPDHDGESYRLSKRKGKVGFVIVFLSTECPVSNAYNFRLIKLAKYAKENNLDFIGINSNQTESFEEVYTHAKAKSLNFPVLKDEENKVADMYGASVTPEAFLIDKNLIVQYHGPIDDNQREERVTEPYLHDAIEQLLNGKHISPDNVKPRGCIIKRFR